MAKDANNDNVFEMLLATREEMAKKVYADCQPEIATVCHLLKKGKQVSEGKIERLFDRVLEHCYNTEIINLFKELCRAVVVQYPQLVQDYIRYYKDQWGE